MTAIAYYCPDTGLVTLPNPVREVIEINFISCPGIKSKMGQELFTCYLGALVGSVRDYVHTYISPNGEVTATSRTDLRIDPGNSGYTVEEVKQMILNHIDINRPYKSAYEVTVVKEKYYPKRCAA